MSPSSPPTSDRPSGGVLFVAHFLPGLLAGTQLAGLIFFLNPDLPFTARGLLRSALFYGGLLGLISTLLLTAVTWRLGSRALRALPWSITAALALAALGHWFSASYYSYYLPPGINVRMIKAAVWLTLTTLICFYIALLHSHQRRPYGWRSRIGFAALALASVYVMAERREAFNPRPEPTPLPSAVEFQTRPTLVVVALEGATLEAILPLARQGRLPFFARLLEQGAYGHSTSFAPARRAALWTTLATGKLPYKHGVLGDRFFPAELLGRGVRLRLLPRLPGFAGWGTLGEPRPSDARSGQSPALWEILARLGIPSGLVGWPLSYPVPESATFAFSDLYFAGDLREGAARPRELAERGLLFQLAAEEIDPSLLEPLGKRLPFSLLEVLAHDLWRESLTRFLLEQRQEVRALFLMLPGLSAVSRSYFGGYAVVEFAGAQRSSAQEAAGFLTGYYRHLDDFLANLWQRLSEPRILVVVSAHGFEAPQGWRKLWFLVSGRPFDGFSTGAPAGVFLLAGAGIRPGTFLENAQLVDVMPTLLYALAFPIARDLDGQVLTSAFEKSFLARHP
ncbi:MAG: alkaline phosphatase family protein, partial [Thermoanaerobaculia bacterium]